MHKVKSYHCQGKHLEKKWFPRSDRKRFGMLGYAWNFRRDINRQGIWIWIWMDFKILMEYIYSPQAKNTQVLSPSTLEITLEERICSQDSKFYCFKSSHQFSDDTGSIVSFMYILTFWICKKVWKIKTVLVWLRNFHMENELQSEGLVVSP